MWTRPYEKGCLVKSYFQTLNKDDFMKTARKTEFNLVLASHGWCLVLVMMMTIIFPHHKISLKDRISSEYQVNTVVTVIDSALQVFVIGH